MTSRIRDLATELKTWPDKLELVGDHLTDFCSRFTDKQRTSAKGYSLACLINQSTDKQPLEFLQALKQLSSKFDWIKKNWAMDDRLNNIGDRLRQIAKEIAQMSDDFLACCLMDKQFVSQP